ncbi:rCG58333 [Rattus norvegicus]|uniref:RCG58333 n=1 Tax=Rattus norvegicus TaxID=10116 RepID=A6J4H6_RAT|nr:rCG58333 [Rattus norvegicus]
MTASITDSQEAASGIFFHPVISLWGRDVEKLPAPLFPSSNNRVPLSFVLTHPTQKRNQVPHLRTAESRHTKVTQIQYPDFTV